MSENKSLLIGVGVIFGVAFALVIGSWAFENDAIGSIDHFVHFHLDVGSAQEDIERQAEQEAADRTQAVIDAAREKEFVEEIESVWKNPPADPNVLVPAKSSDEEVAAFNRFLEQQNAMQNQQGDLYNSRDQ